MVRTCQFCKKKYQTQPSKLLKFCCQVCYGKSMEGKTPNNKGYKWSKKQRERMSQSKKGQQAWLGKKHTQESKEKMSLAKKGKKLTREHIKNSLRRRKMSGLEIKVNDTIKKYKLPYKFVGNGKFFIEKKNPDFVNTNGKKIAVEVYCRKHKDLFRGSCEKWRQERQEIFKKYGWGVVFIEDWQTNSESSILELLNEGGQHS